MSAGPELDVWLIDLDRHGAVLAQLAIARGVLGAADRQRLAGYRRRAGAEAFAASRAGLDLVLARYGAKPGLRMRRGPAGKPFVPGLPPFSFSRTPGHAAVAVSSKGAVGLDIELARPLSPGHPLVERVARRLARQWPPDKQRVAAWTIVEAWAKLHGARLADLLDDESRGGELEAALASLSGRFREPDGRFQLSWKGSDGRGPGPALVPLALPAGLAGHCWHEGTAARISMRRLEPPFAART